MKEETKINKLTSKEATVIFLIGILGLALELTQVKMLSFFLGSISSFLAIPIALFGLALGSIVYHFCGQARRIGLVKLAIYLLYPATLIVFVTIFYVANTFFNEIHVSVSTPLRDPLRLLFYSSVYLPPYILLGTLLSHYFTIYSAQIGRLYFFDLFGAGIGCFIVPFLFTVSDLPWVILTLLFLAAFILLLAELRFLSMPTLILMLSLCILSYYTGSGALFREKPDPAMIARTLLYPGDSTDVEEVAVRWNHLARAALYKSNMYKGNPYSQFVVIQDDGISNVGVTDYKAQSSNFLRKKSVLRAIPYILGGSPKNILVMFAGAGRDMVVLDALSEGQASVTGVELNSAVLDLALHPAAKSKNIKEFLEKDNIHYVIKEGRDFLNNDQNKYDFIYAATNGAVHANRTGHTRKYLNTYEALRSYVKHLTDDGMIIFANQPVHLKIPMLRDLHEKRGGTDFSKHLYLLGHPVFEDLRTLVYRMTPFSEKEIAIISSHHQKLEPGWQTIFSPFDIENSDIKDLVVGDYTQKLVTDDRPFYRKINFSQFEFFPGKAKLRGFWYSSNWIKIFTCLLFVAISIVTFLFVSILSTSTSRLPIGWMVYFFTSGIAYMGVQIGLIGKVELLLGNPLYAVAVILALFLISNGFGANFQDKKVAKNHCWGLMVWTFVAVLWALVFGEFCNQFLLSYPLPIKVLLVTIAVVPAGFFIGRFYPLGVSKLVSQGKGECVPLSYAAATLSSVLGSAVMVTLLFNLGFSQVVLLGALGYLLTSLVFFLNK